MNKLQEIEERLNKITPELGKSFQEWRELEPEEERDAIIRPQGYYEHDFLIDSADSEILLNAPEDIRWLIEEVKRLRAIMDYEADKYVYELQEEK